MMKTLFIISAISCFGFVVLGHDVLMMIGGMSTKQRITNLYRSVEIIDAASTCMGPALPYPLFGHVGVKLRNSIVTCGGYDGRYERGDCLELRKTWTRHSSLPHESIKGQGLMFAASTSDGNFRFFLAGGRSFNHTERRWEYVDEVWMFHDKHNNWEALPNLPKPMASGCMVYVNGDLIFLGGSIRKYRYADDPSKVWVLVSKSKVGKGETWRWRDDLIPPMMGPRIWHGCVTTNLDGRAGILVAGGYHAGRLSMFYPLDPEFLVSGVYPKEKGKWESAGWLPDHRQWGPGLGLVAGVPTIVSGRDYGDNTLDAYNGWEEWKRDDNPWRKMRHNREFSVGVTVPDTWTKLC